MILTGNIDEVTRKVTFEQTSAVVAVVGDYDVNGVAFGFPASYEDDFDLSTGVKTVYYEATDGTIYNHVITDTDTDTGLPLWVFTDEINKGEAGTVKFAIVIDQVDSDANITKRWVSLITSFQVRQSIEIDTSEEEANEQTYSERLATLMTQVAAMQTVVDGLASGTPTAVSTVAEMTNESLIYLYTGSESGYTAGNWYYYNGSAWTSGGAYGNSSEVIAARTNAETGTTYTDLQTRLDTEYSEIKEDLSTISSVPTTVRAAIYTLLNSAAYTVTGLTDEMATVQSWAAEVTAVALDQSVISISGASTVQLTATTTPSGGVVSWASSDTSVATVDSTGLVTGVGNGTATITATSGDHSATCTASVSGFVTLTSISAVYTQSGTVYTTDSLDSLKSDLVVTAHYSDSTSGIVTGYTLSGVLAEGTQTIAVAYGGKTDTFTVDCTVKGYLYHFEQSLVSSGSEDFGWQGTENYSEGASGAGYSYWHKVTTEGTSSTDVGAIYANGLAKVPDLSGDFTISYWSKSITEKRGQGISPFKIGSTSTALPTTGFGDVGNVKTGYTVSPETVNNQVEGIRLWYKGGTAFQVRLISAEITSARAYNITGFPSGYTSTVWHHYAVTRKSGTVYVFIDGEVVFTVSCSESLLFNNQVSLGGYFDGAGSTTPVNNSYGNYFDDLFIAEYCKWDSDFDPAAIAY